MGSEMCIRDRDKIFSPTPTEVLTMATYEEVANKFGITVDQARVLKEAMETTWSVIGWDFVSCFPGGEAEAYEVFGSEKAMVAEATIDADRIKAHNPGLDLTWVSRMPDGSWRGNALDMAEAVWEARN